MTEKTLPSGGVLVGVEIFLRGLHLFGNSSGTYTRGVATLN